MATDVVTPAVTGNVIKNGAIVVHVSQGGDIQKIDPQINSFVPSGTMFTRWDNRFDEHYGGGPS